MNSLLMVIKVATCFRCGSSIFQVEDQWYHRDKDASRGCRLATYDPDTGYYDDSLGNRYLAAPDKSTIKDASVEIPPPSPPLKILVADALEDLE